MFEITYPGSLKTVLGFRDLIVGTPWDVEKTEKMRKTIFFWKKGPNMILGAHHNNIKNDDFDNLQHLFQAYFDASNFL